jgi:Zn finger protein HypA/HybF involved in hydrogenase expression
MSLVAELVDECCRRVDGQAVSLVRVRCSLPDIDGELQQAFTMLTAATPLQDAVLQVETLPVIVDCPCGYVGPAAEDVLVGHLFVCPDCSRVGPVRSPTLELLEVRMSPSTPFPGEIASPRD